MFDATVTAVPKGRPRELALLITGASGLLLPRRFAEIALESDAIDTLHLVMTPTALQVAAHELGPDCASARRFVDALSLSDAHRDRIAVWSNDDLGAPISSGSHPLIATVILPCSAGTAGAIAHGISRGLVQRAADVALKQRWPLIIGIRETPMSEILLANLLTLARAGAFVVPPAPAFYLKPDPATAWADFIDHYCMRLLDLAGLFLDRLELRWKP